MAGGWRRVFCTSVVREDLRHDGDDDNADADSDDQQQKHHHRRRNLSSRLGFFSNPSSPRLQSSLSSFSPNLRCKTTTEKISPASAPVSPKTHSNKSNPRFFFKSNPSSPKSPSSFSFLRPSSRFSKSRCGICLQNVKSGLGTAIFTAECSHVFHYPCVSVIGKSTTTTPEEKKKNSICPVCHAQWTTVPHLDSNLKSIIPKPELVLNDDVKKIRETVSVAKNLKVYNDDEPLRSPVAGRGRGFVAIPESNESEDEFQYHVTSNVAVVSPVKLDMKLQPEAAVIAVNRKFETRAVALTVTVKSPLSEADDRESSSQQHQSNRAPVDLVAVINVSDRLCIEKQQSIKKAMRFVISSLSCNDRLSIVVFSDTSKRLMPLKKMTATGRRLARRIVDVLGCIGQHACASDAVKKATKVLEDRHEKNNFSAILLLSDGSDDFTCTKTSNRNRPFFPVSKFDFTEAAHALSSIENVFTKWFREVINPTVQDLRFDIELKSITGSQPVQVTVVYQNQAGRPSVSESGLIKLGDLYAEDQERELLIELKVPISPSGAHHVLTVRSSYRDPSSPQKLVVCKDQSLLVPQPLVVKSSSSSFKIERLRFTFVATRAVAESRKLSECNDLSGAYHLLNSARTLLMRSHSSLASEYLLVLEAELVELNRVRKHQIENQRLRLVDYSVAKCGNGEPLTPTSAWKAAERLAKVAVMRKSLNRVGDLHGFENARF